MMSLWQPGAAVPQLCRDALWIGASVGIRSTLVLAIGLLLGQSLRRSGPAVASLVYRTVLIGVVLVDLLSFTVAGSLAPVWRIPVAPAVGTLTRPVTKPAPPGGAGVGAAASLAPPGRPNGRPLAASVPDGAGDGTVEQVTLIEDGTTAPAAARSEGRGGRLPVWRSGWLAVAAVGLWGAGSLLLLAWLGLCHRSIRLLRRQSRPVTEGEAAALLRSLCVSRRIATPALLADTAVRSPFLAGLFRPAILLPASYEHEFEGPALHAILAHEVAHLARRDCAWNLLARLACAFGWAQPLLWVLCRRMEQAGEEVCDQEVLAQQCPARVYADCLLTLAERCARSPERALGVGLVPFRSSLGRRIQAILDAAGRPATAVTLRLRAGILLGTASLVAASLAAVAAPAGSGGAASPQSPGLAALREAIPTTLRGDARLEAKVTLAYKDRPVGEVVTAIGQQIGVRLVATRETADDKVTLFLDERPAAEALALLARHFDFQWQRNHGGFELTQDLASKAREAAQRERERAAQVAAIQARMGRLSQMVGMPRERLDARRTELDRLLAAPKQAADERARLAGEREAIQDLLRPGGSAAAAIYLALTPLQLAQLRNGGEVRLSSSDGTLSPALSAAVKQAAEQPAQPGRDGERDVQRIVAGIATHVNGAGAAPNDPGPPVEESTVSIQLTDAGALKPFRPRQGPPQLQLAFTLTSVQGTQNMRRMMPVRWSPTVTRAATVPAAAAAPSPDPALQREVELPLPKPAAGAPQPPGAAGAVRIPGTFGAWPADMPTLADVGEMLHRATGLEFVADSFVRDRLNAGTLAGKRPLAQLLDTIAHELEYDWVKEGSLLRFRSRLYPQDRLAEVPERILRPWHARVARTGAPSLDDMAELAAALSDAQCRGMQDYWGWYLQKPEIPAPPGLGGLADNRYHLRFWATLNPAQRREALAGGTLPVDRMNGPQRQAFQVALTAPNESGILRMEMRGTPTPAEIAAGGFSLRISQMSQQVSRATGPDGRQMATVTIGPATLPGAAGRGGGAAGQFGAGGGGGGGGVVVPFGAPGGGGGLVVPAVPPGGGPRLSIPEGLTLEPAGAPTLLDSFVFTYHVAGDPAPARVAPINLPRPVQKS